MQANANGMPADIVPQAVETREIRISRYDLYQTVMEEVFGSFEAVNLCDQYRPFSLREVWGAPGAGASFLLNAIGVTAPGISITSAGPVIRPPTVNLPENVGLGFARAFDALSAGAQPRQYEYRGCYFSNLGRTIDAKSDRVISVDASITYLTRQRIV